MSGDELKRILYRLNITQTDLAEKLGTSQQNVYATLKAADIKTGFLERLCKEFALRISDFYPEDYDAPTTIVNANRAKDTAISTGSGSATASGNEAESAMIKALMEQNKQLLDLIEKLASKQ